MGGEGAGLGVHRSLFITAPTSIIQGQTVIAVSGSDGASSCGASRPRALPFPRRDPEGNPLSKEMDRTHLVSHICIGSV